MKQLAENDRTPVEVTLVVADDCHLCDHAREVLKSLADELSLAVRTVQLDSVEGQKLAERIALIFPPVLLRDGVVISYGRLSQRRLRKELASA